MIKFTVQMVQFDKITRIVDSDPNVDRFDTTVALAQFCCNVDTIFHFQFHNARFETTGVCTQKCSHVVLGSRADSFDTTVGEAAETCHDSMNRQENCHELVKLLTICQTIPRRQF
jgi:hypothetical protein